MPVIHCNDAHLPEDFELRVWGPHAMRGTPGAETIPEVKPEPKDIVLEKRTYSAFYETGVDHILRAHDVKELVIAGLPMNICDRHTSPDAFFRGYVPVIPDDGVEATDEQAHLSGLDYLKTIYGAKITHSDAVMKAWK